MKKLASKDELISLSAFCMQAICPEGGAQMAKSTEKYECMYVLNPNLTEEETAAIVEKFKALVEANGTLDEMEEMGKRKLAYEINYLTEGYYVLVKFTSAPDFPAELDRVLGITDGVIRSLITLRCA
jgi:small subunit ribosomal protein S6